VLVGPDNGLFCPLLADQDLVATDSGRLHGEVAAVELTEHRFWLDHVSQTFHGRDIFAPAAAHLATGVDLNRLGAPLLEIHCIAQQLPTRRDDRLLGMVIHVDRFGNAITNIRADVLPEQPVFEIGGRSLPGLATSYQDARMVAIEGSTGLVEIAVRNASAADTLGLRVGDAVLVRSAV
jgi:S-adenosylmethionine hydrolase